MRSALVALAFVLFTAAAHAQIRFADDKVTVQGDLRFRFESDWDSQRPNGNLRDDRDRLRIRARLGLNWNPIDPVTVAFRLRTGRRTAQQSPHLTIWDFQGNDTGPKEVTFDRFFVDFRGSHTEAWFGRNSYPFWKQHGLFWNDDVSVTGATLLHSWDGDASDVRVTGGYYLLPDGMEDFAGNMLGGQLLYDFQGQRIGTSLASGMFLINGADSTENLRNGNGTRDYKMFVANAQARLSHPRFPVTVGVDFTHNFQYYSPNDSDSVTAANHDQTTGFVASVVLGRTREKWEWLVAYYYAYIETLAVNASFTQDDWMRWGSQGQTDSSDFKGNEFRFAMAFNPDTNVVARYYLVNAITTVQDGKRFRVDLNYRF